MSVTLDQKNNGSFSHECQWLTDSVGKDFTGYTPSCKIKDPNGNLVHEFTVGTDLTWVDQSIGKVLIKVIDTSLWPVRVLVLDLTFTQDSDSFTRVTRSFNINMINGIT